MDRGDHIRHHHDENDEYTDAPWRDAELLHQLHHERGLEQYEIADELNCTPTTISRWMRRLGVEQRNAVKHSTGGLWQDELLLREMYHERGMTQQEIAAELDTKIPTISKWFVKHGIKSRQHYDETPPWRDESKLRSIYAEQRLSPTKIAERWDCDSSTVSKWLQKFKIER